MVHLRIGHLPSLFPGRAGQRLLRTHSTPTRRRSEPWLVHAVSAERAASSDAAATPMRRSVCHSLADLSACSCGLPSLHPRQRGLIDDGQSSTTSCVSVDACSRSSMSLRDGATTRTANVCRRPKASSCSSSKTGTSCPACTRDPLGSPSCSTRSPQPRPDSGVGTLRMTARAGSSRRHQTTSGLSIGETRMGTGPRFISIGPAPGGTSMPYLDQACLAVSQSPKAVAAMPRFHQMGGSFGSSSAARLLKDLQSDQRRSNLAISPRLNHGTDQEGASTDAYAYAMRATPRCPRA